MIEETVHLNFDGKNLDEIEARLVRAADAMVERLKSGSAGVSVGGGSSAPGSGSPGGASGGMGASGGGSSDGQRAVAAGLSAALNGAAQGMGNLTPATVNSPGVVAQEAALGAARGVGGLLAQGAGTLIGAAAGSVLGPAGTAVGAAAGNAIGSYVGKQFDALDESVHKPSDTTAARLKGFVGTLESHGIHVGDKFVEQQARLGIQIERHRLEGERRAERITKETGVHMGSLAYGISQLGR